MSEGTVFDPGFFDAIERKLQAGHWGAVLAEVANVVLKAMQTPQLKFLVTSSPALDRYCRRVGEISRPQAGIAPADSFDDTLVVYIATELYWGAGGHTLALKDIIRAQPGKRHVVLLTNLQERPGIRETAEKLLAEISPAPLLEVSENMGPVDNKMLWLHQRLRALRPGRLILANHHFDSVAVAAALPGVAGETIYFHHADHHLALGVHLPDARHVDCSSIVYQRCRDFAGVAHQSYWPLVAPDAGPRAAGHVFMPGGALTTCSHGSYVKFLAPAQFSYRDFVRERLRAVPGRHIHIGQLDAEYLVELGRHLAGSGIDAARFVYVAPVASLWAFLRDSDIDLCLSSYPIGGAKGLVETMGAGLPVLIHDNPASKQFSCSDLAYPEALAWVQPHEFVAALQGVDAAMLERHAALARAHYERWHHPRELEAAVNSPAGGTEPPPSKPPRCDTFALFCS